MADELIDLLDDKGNKTGRTVMKHEAHVKGLWHETAHVWIYTTKREILLQQRSKKHSDIAGLWDFSAGGHIETGQGVESAAIREVKEELGLNISKQLLKKVFDLKAQNSHDGIKNNEYYRVFLYKLHSIPKFILQKEEVADAKFISIDLLEKELKDPVKRKQYVSHGAYWFKAIDAIKKELQ